MAIRVQVSDGRKRSSSQQSVWTRDLIDNTGYVNSDLQNCAKNYFQLASLIQRSELQSILRKFTQPKYLEVARIMNTITKKHDEQIAQQQREASAATTTVGSSSATGQKQNPNRTHTTNSSNGKQKRGTSSSTGKITNLSNMNSTSGSVKHMTSKQKNNSSNAMSSAESKKI